MNDHRAIPKFVALLLPMVFLTAVVEGAPPPVQFELITDDGFSPTDSQKWVQFLSKLELTSIRIRQGEPGEHASITNIGREGRPLYVVIGILTGQNRLRLPGGEFALGERERLSAWLKKVETDGEAGPTQKTTSFGLTAEQLVSFHEKLTGAITCETKGRRCGDVARDIVKGVPLEFAVSDAAKQAFGTAEVCEDDLQGLSAGTALAAVIRPLGLVLRPEKSGKNVRLWICEVRETEEAWPIGWPSEETPGRIAPKLFESVPVEIKDFAMSKALAAIQPRVGIPFLIDHNGMARQKIDLTAVKVKYPSGRAMYRKVLDQLLYQSKLTSDLRVDEAGTPFLWISPR